MTPFEFKNKWRPVQGKETSFYQSHFDDLLHKSRKQTVPAVNVAAMSFLKAVGLRTDVVLAADGLVTLPASLRLPQDADDLLDRMMCLLHEGFPFVTRKPPSMAYFIGAQSMLLPYYLPLSPLPASTAAASSMVHTAGFPLRC